MGEFNDKVVVITGGNSGLGKALAEYFDKEGAYVVLFGRDQKKLDRVAGSLKKSLAVKGDVSQVSDLDRLYRETAKFGKIDVLVANAGVAELRPLKDVDEAFFDQMVSTNYKGVYFTVQRSLDSLKDGASIILISSGAAHIGWPSHSVYSSTKAAVSYLARSFSGDLMQRGIRVNAVSPGFIDTPMNAGLKDAPEILEKIISQIPANRFARAEEIARAVTFLASKQSSYIMGADLVVDGGLTAVYPIKL